MPRVIDHLRAAWDELTAPGAFFAMSEIEVRGIPIRVFDGAPPNMRVLWETTAAHADKPYVVYEDERYTYAEIDALVRALAHHLRDVHGVGSGDRVALAMRNYPEWVIGYWAITAIGAAVVGLNAWWTTPEMEYGLSDSRPKVLIADDERLERALPLLGGLREQAPLHVISVRSSRELPDDATRWEDVIRPEAAPAGLPDATIDPDDDATIFYTSGTTGFPKGAQLTHRGSVHNIMHLMFWAMTTAAADAKAIAAGDIPAPTSVPAPPGQPVFMAPTPLFHVTACNCLLHPATLTGGRIVLTYKWNPERALELIEREGVTNFSGVPTMSRELLAHPDWERRDTSSLLGMGGGGAPLQPDLVEKIDKSLNGGAPSTGYGLTETHGIVTANSARYFLSQAGVVRAGDADTRRQARRRGRHRPPRRAGHGRAALRARAGRHQGLPEPARRHRREHRATAGSTRATSPGSTRTASCSSSIGPRTWSCVAARTCTARRSRRPSTSTTPSPRRPCSGCPTNAWVKTSAP